jgi:maleylpyruvate isomerase
MRLFSCFRSSAAWRGRIALAFKGVPWTPEFVHLQRDGGEPLRPAYRAKNPTALIPTLETDDGALLLQSLAIIEWLEETYPTTPLLPVEPLARAKCAALR